ncbi:MAG: hypothetical protein RBU30_04200, partial [Polyangia bacterium]|nr:hypothetical protein [Polyangia bacterium]
MTIRPMDRLLLASLAAALISGCGPSKGGNDNNTNHHVGFCGDGIVSLGELCDGANLNGQSCTTIGQSFTGGNLACGSSCTSWNTTGCTGGALCGNGSIDQGELCDGANLNGQSCTTIGQGFTGGTLGCSSTCASWSTTGCTGGALCGNGVIDTGELCDGANLNGQSCTTIGQGFTGGNLACGSTCASWNTSGCTGGGSWTCDPSYYGGGDGCDCGCGVVDPDCAGSSSSVCEYCNEYGSCDEEGTDCSNIDPANNALCITVQCGNGVAQGAEVCDGADYKGETCESQGFITGSLACSVTCDALVTTGCSGTPVCGNGVIEGLETCDGSSNLGGQTCTSLGYSGGTLGCGLGCSLTTFGCNGWTCDPTFDGDGYGDCGCGLVDSDCYGASSA